MSTQRKSQRQSQAPVQVPVQVPVQIKAKAQTKRLIQAQKQTPKQRQAQTKADADAKAEAQRQTKTQALAKTQKLAKTQALTVARTVARIKEPEPQESISLILYEPRVVEDKEDIMKMSMFNQQAEIDDASYPCGYNDAFIFPAIMPQLSYPQQTTGRGCSEGILYGFAGEVSLAKVRGETFDAFCRSMLSYSVNGKLYDYKQTISITITEDLPGVFKINNWGTNRIGNFSFDYNELRNIFETRKDLVNEKTVNADQAMVKMLALLNEFEFILRKDNQITVKRVIDSIGLVASAKQVLDIGALYAILDKTYDNNQHLFNTGQVLQRCDALVSYIDSNRQEINIDFINELIQFISVDDSYLDVFFAKNAVLETSDGAAATIAGTYFTILSDTSKGSGVKTTFMNVDRLFNIIMYCCLNDGFLIYIERVLTEIAEKKSLQIVISNIINMIKILNVLYKTELLDIRKKCLIVDVFFYIIYNIKINDLETDILQLYEPQTGYMQIPRLQRLKIIFFELFSVAKFIFTSIGGKNNIKQLLMNCNFDSQCHDNKTCQYYRLICIYYFIRNCQDYKSAWTSLMNHPMYWTSFDILSNSVKDDYLNEKKTAVIENGTYGTFENFEFYLEKLLQNFNIEQKILFYELAMRKYDDIEELLNQRMLHNCDIVLKCNETADVYITAPMTFENLLLYQIIQRVPRQVTLNPVMIPFYSNIAIDLSIEWSMSTIKDVKTVSDNTSVLIYTPVSYIDAASNRMYATAEYLDNPVKMPIITYSTNLSTDFPQCGYTFIKSFIPKVNIITNYEEENNTNSDYLNMLLNSLKTHNDFTNEINIKSKIDIFITIYYNFVPVKDVSSSKYKFRLTLDKFATDGRGKIIVDTYGREIDSLFTSMTNIEADPEDTIQTFLKIFEPYYQACTRFQSKKTRDTIKSFRFTEIIFKMCDDLINFFKDNQDNSSPEISINQDLFSKYYPYLKLLIASINGESRNRVYYEIYNMFKTPNVKFSIGTDVKPSSTRPTRGKQRGGNDNALFLTDFVGSYGSYLSINEKGKFTLEAINTQEQVKKLEDMFKNLYNVKIGPKQKQLPTSVGVSVSLPGGKTEQWWIEAGNKIINNPDYKKLPDNQKDQKYKEIIGRIWENIKTMQNDEEAISNAIQVSMSSPIRTELDTEKRMSIIPLETHQQLITPAYGGKTRRRNNKNKLTKKQRKIRERKIRERKIRERKIRERKTTCKYRIQKHRYSRHKNKY